MTQYSNETRKKLFGSISNTEGLLLALLLNMAYPKPLFQTGYAITAKNAKQMMKKSPNSSLWKKYADSARERRTRKGERLLKKSSGILCEGNR